MPFFCLHKWLRPFDFPASNMGNISRRRKFCQFMDLFAMGGGNLLFISEIAQCSIEYIAFY